MYPSTPIGIFDSGLGGLSILNNITKTLPNEDVIYFADQKNIPYGDKSEEFIINRSKEIVNFLTEKKAKILVIACNTVTTIAIKKLREICKIPIVGVEPAIKPALAISKKKVGVLATSGTAQSLKFKELIERFDSDKRLLVQPCPGLVELVESGELNSLTTKKFLNQYVRKLLDDNVDVIVLGCTHYPFLISEIGEIAGDEIKIIESSEAVSAEVKRQLEKNKIGNKSEQNGKLSFYTSKSETEFASISKRLLPLFDFSNVYRALDQS